MAQNPFFSLLASAVRQSSATVTPPWLQQAAVSPFVQDTLNTFLPTPPALTYMGRAPRGMEARGWVIPQKPDEILFWGKPPEGQARGLLAHEFGHAMQAQRTQTDPKFAEAMMAVGMAQRQHAQEADRNPFEYFADAFKDAVMFISDTGDKTDVEKLLEAAEQGRPGVSAMVQYLVNAFPVFQQHPLRQQAQVADGSSKP